MKCVGGGGSCEFSSSPLTSSKPRSNLPISWRHFGGGGTPCLICSFSARFPPPPALENSSWLTEVEPQNTGSNPPDEVVHARSVDPWNVMGSVATGSLESAEVLPPAGDKARGRVSKPTKKGWKNEQAVSVGSSSNLGRHNGHRPTLRMAPWCAPAARTRN